MHSTKIALLALATAVVCACCRKELGYTIHRYKNSYLYGDTVNTWYPVKIVKTYKKTVPTDTTPVVKTVAVYVNRNPDTSNFQIIFSKQHDYDFLVDYKMPDSMANLLRVPNSGEANLDEGDGSIILERKYMVHQRGNMFNDKTYIIFNKDSTMATEEVEISFR